MRRYGNTRFDMYGGALEKESRARENQKAEKDMKKAECTNESVLSSFSVDCECENCCGHRRRLHEKHLGPIGELPPVTYTQSQLDDAVKAAREACEDALLDEMDKYHPTDGRYQALLVARGRLGK